MLAQLQLSDFSDRIGDAFVVRLVSGDSLTLELIEAVPLGSAPDDGRRQAFSLIFRNDRTDAYLPQGIHTLHHAELGEIALFLVPLGPDGQGMRYEVIFG